MITLINPDLLVKRLIEKCPAFADRVFGTIPDDELSIDSHESPVAFVYLNEDKADYNKLVGGGLVRQHMTSDIAVEIVVRRTATSTDRFNDAANKQFICARHEVLAALIGWRPTQAAYPMLHMSGAMHKKDKKVLKFIDHFSVEIHQQIRKS